MTVRRLRAKQRHHLCNHCGEWAFWRGCHFTRFACQDHRKLLEDEDSRHERRDSYQSDAEWIIGL